LLLRNETISFGGNILQVLPVDQWVQPPKPHAPILDKPKPAATPAQLKPRSLKAGSKKRVLALPTSMIPPATSDTSTSSAVTFDRSDLQASLNQDRPGMKNQSDFRQMLLSKKAE
jgi:hypothetical protein